MCILARVKAARPRAGRGFYRSDTSGQNAEALQQTAFRPATLPAVQAGVCRFAGSNAASGRERRNRFPPSRRPDSESSLNRPRKIPSKGQGRSDARANPAPAISPGRLAAIFALLLVGIGIWIAIGSGRWIGTVRWVILAAGGLAGLAPVVSGRVHAAADALRRPSPPRLALRSVGVAIAAAAYLLLTAWLQNRDLFPRTHDDSSYMIQMQMLARGRLWMPPLPLPEFFDSFYILTRPVYASQYFPGTAMLYVPTIWLHLPTWLPPALASGAAVGLLHQIIAELIDGAAGALAALWIVSLTWFRTVCVLLMSQTPALLFGLLIVFGWLRWRRHRRDGWLLFIGAAAGWAAITRPLDALCFAIPVGVALLIEYWRTKPRAIPVAGLLLVASAAPFLAVQLVFDRGVTGHWLETPFQLYLDQDAPGTGFGFHRYDPNARPVSQLPQKQEYYEKWAVPFILRHQPNQVVRTWLTRWFPMIVDTTMPARILLLPVAVGLLGLTCRRRRVLWATLPLFVGLYFFYPIFLEHYAIALIPAVALMVLLGIGELERIGRGVGASATIVVILCCVTSLWEINRWIAPPSQRVDDETIRSAILHTVNVDLPAAADLHRPAVILFRYHHGDNFFEEPVYNTDVAWPNDAPIVRAHDLGVAKDRSLVDWYAAHQPDRSFYLFDARAAEPIRYLGRADDPAQVLRSLAATETPNG